MRSADPAPAPAVRINQLGYRPDAPKRATWPSAAESTPFAVLDGSDAVVLTGWSQPWPVRPDPSSGLAVHVLDFSALRTPGEGYVLRVAGADSHRFAVRADAYRGLASDALELFYLLRSGCPIDADRAPGYARPAGHPGDAAVPAWSGPDAERLYPGWSCPGRFDVSGGWYDAGDYGKYVPSGAIAVWQLLNTLTLLDQADPLRERLVAECRWQLDWLLRMRVPAGYPLAGLVFHRVHGTEWSPLPGWAHEDPTTRVLHRPSTTASLQVAAVAAQGARLLRELDPGYADRLLTAARDAYRAARAHPLLLAPDDEGRFGGGPYGDPDPDDDVFWAATELWLATGEDGFAADRRAARPPEEALDGDGFDYDRVAGPALLDLAVAGSAAPDQDQVLTGVLAAARRLRDLQTAQPWGQPYAPREWAWGSNGRILNNLVVLATAARLSGDRELVDAVAEGMDYLLGRNALARSYVVGHGPGAVAHPRTRQFGHDLDPSFPPAPAGALVGGANSAETPGFPSDPRLAGLPPQLRHLDEPTSETTNDICIRWNAPLVFVAAFLSGR